MRKVLESSYFMLKVDESLGAKVGKGRRVGSCAIESPDDGQILEELQEMMVILKSTR